MGAESFRVVSELWLDLTRGGGSFVGVNCMERTILVTSFKRWWSGFIIAYRRHLVLSPIAGWRHWANTSFGLPLFLVGNIEKMLVFLFPAHYVKKLYQCWLSITECWRSKSVKLRFVPPNKAWEFCQFVCVVMKMRYIFVFIKFSERHFPSAVVLLNRAVKKCLVVWKFEVKWVKPRRFFVSYRSFFIIPRQLIRIFFAGLSLKKISGALSKTELKL